MEIYSIKYMHVVKKDKVQRGQNDNEQRGKAKISWRQSIHPDQNIETPLPYHSHWV
jgi:hypothetical protein